MYESFDGSWDRLKSILLPILPHTNNTRATGLAGRRTRHIPRPLSQHVVHLNTRKFRFPVDCDPLICTLFYSHPVASVASSLKSARADRSKNTDSNAWCETVLHYWLEIELSGTKQIIWFMSPSYPLINYFHPISLPISQTSASQTDDSQRLLPREC